MKILLRVVDRLSRRCKHILFFWHVISIWSNFWIRIILFVISGLGHIKLIELLVFFLLLSFVSLRWSHLLPTYPSLTPLIASLVRFKVLHRWSTSWLIRQALYRFHRWVTPLFELALITLHHHCLILLLIALLLTSFPMVMMLPSRLCLNLTEPISLLLLLSLFPEPPHIGYKYLRCFIHPLFHLIEIVNIVKKSNFYQLLFKFTGDNITLQIFLNFNTGFVATVIGNAVTELTLTVDFPLGLEFWSTFIFFHSKLKTKLSEHVPPKLILDHESGSLHFGV